MEKNVPQVSMTNKMTFSQGKMEIQWQFLHVPDSHYY
jgi:hypothetical protein